MNKQAIRTQLLKKRKRLNAKQVQSLSHLIIQHIIQSELFQQAQHIALYLPFNGEVDLTALLLRSDKHCYLPSIQGESMQFQRYDEHLKLHDHSFGLKQPTFIGSLAEAELDLCLMPLVGFDTQGNRLGMGGGFYDRYFAHNNHTDTVLAGVGYQFQQQSKLPVHSWDVKINHIFTDQGHTQL